MYTYTLFYGSDDKQADFLTDKSTGEDRCVARCLILDSSTCLASADDYPTLKDCVTLEAAPVQSVDGSDVQYYNIISDIPDNKTVVAKRFKEFDTVARLLRRFLPLPRASATLEQGVTPAAAAVRTRTPRSSLRGCRSFPPRL